jgi:hypothetical protein
MRRIALFALTVAACTTFHGVKPLDPAQGNPSWAPEIETLQPTLRWTPADAPATTYDLAIYEGVIEGDFWHGEKRVPGGRVYYREGLPAPEHRLEQQLEEGKHYFWSVRTRNGETVSPWSTYDWKLFLVLGWRFVYNAPFRFRTPDAGRAAGK